eukprot:COSAG06_NODE_54361_length_295_cov_0.617347_1_plen_43_part_10
MRSEDRRDSAELKPAIDTPKTYFFLNFSYVCPEPVLVKRSVFI